MAPPRERRVRAWWRARQRDKRRAAFVELSYRIPWDSTRFFDLVVDTGKVQPGQAVPIIAQVSRVARGEGGVGGKLAGDDDPVVRDAIADALGCRAEHIERGGHQPQAPVTA